MNTTGDSEQPSIQIELATKAVLPQIIELLADDPLGAQREDFRDPLPAGYVDAFDSIDRDENNSVLVAMLKAQVIGVLQLTIIPNLTYQGRPRAQIEGVRVSSAQRGSGIGKSLILEAIGMARAKQCHLVQLTTDKRRPDAIRFYQQLGFESTHEGMKLRLGER